VKCADDPLVLDRASEQQFHFRVVFPRIDHANNRIEMRHGKRPSPHINLVAVTPGCSRKVTSVEPVNNRRVSRVARPFRSVNHEL
jgi:hypothetical protein